MYCSHLRPLERHLEQKPALNMVYAALELVLWFVLSCGFAVPSLSYTPGMAIPFATLNGIVTVYHLILFYSIHRHIFNYEYPKMLPQMMNNREPHSLLRVWLVMPIGQGLLLFGFLMHWVAGLLLAIFIPFYLRRLLTRELPVEYEAGTKPVQAFRVREHYRALLSPTDPGIFFGGAWLPTAEMTTHMKIIGGTRSGKTNLLRLFMQSALPGDAMGTRARALIYDPKTEFVPLFVGMGIPESNIRILNPFDARGYSWDMAKDLTDDLAAESLAQIFVPENPRAGSGKFFEDATRIVLGAVAKLFMEYAPGRWTLRDLVLACESIDIISLLLENDPDLRADLRVVGSGETAGNVMATIATVTRRGLKTVAAYLHYHHSHGRTFTLKDWMSDRYILLLGCDRRSDATLRQYNQLLMTRTSQLLTSQYNEGYTYLILDELPELGKIGDIDRVARLGAAYKVCLCIAFQAYSNLKEIYGDNIANSLIGQCDKSAYLRALDSETADWQARQIGQTRYRSKMKSYDPNPSLSGKDASGADIQSLSEHHQKEYLFPPEFFLSIARPELKSRTGLTGVYRIGNFTHPDRISSRYLSRHLRPTADNVAKFEDTPPRLKLLRWNRADAERLNFAEILRGTSIERLEGTDFYRLLSHGELTPDLPLEDIPLPPFLSDDDEGSFEAIEDSGDGDDSDRDIDDDRDTDYGSPSNQPPKPPRSPRR
ncbi:MAG: type IV secretion system DNA-binding domain-containing protein [Cyanobacteriota bacterium]|nr:type IV secretion system DNA-binding domain-containing protein [Cyanobacteriota bacterium]